MWGGNLHSSPSWQVCVALPACMCVCLCLCDLKKKKKAWQSLQTALCSRPSLARLWQGNDSGEGCLEETNNKIKTSRVGKKERRGTLISHPAFSHFHAALVERGRTVHNLISYPRLSSPCPDRCVPRHGPIAAALTLAVSCCAASIINEGRQE